MWRFDRLPTLCSHDQKWNFYKSPKSTSSCSWPPMKTTFGNRARKSEPIFLIKISCLMFVSFHFGSFIFLYFGCLEWPKSSSMFDYLISVLPVLPCKNKQMEHIVKKITQLKGPKYKKTKLRKWNETNNYQYQIFIFYFCIDFRPGNCKKSNTPTNLSSAFEASKRLKTGGVKACGQMNIQVVLCLNLINIGHLFSPKGN